MALSKFKVKLIAEEMLTKNVKHLKFIKVDGEPFTFVPGQFITFLFKYDNIIKRRSYSIATLNSNSEIIEIAISYISKGIASEIMFNMNIGDQFDVLGPVGKLTLQCLPSYTERLILIGTGTGIVPYRSMLPELCTILDNKTVTSVTVIQGVQYQSDILYCKNFIDFANNYSNVEFLTYLSREKASLEKNQFKGYVQNYFDGIDLSENDIIYLCGNPNMIDDTMGILKQKDFISKNIKREKYISSN